MMQYNAINTRPEWANVRSQLTYAVFNTVNHNLFYNRAIAFAISSLTGGRISLHTLLDVFDTIIAFERNIFNRSLVLNALVNFCILHGDGDAVQHQLLNRILGVLLIKYY